MYDYQINNPNDYVPDAPDDSAPALPPSAIGKGGLSAINIASRGSPQQPNGRLLGGLQDFTQGDLENLLMPRVRTTEQLNSSQDARRAQLKKLQDALMTPEDSGLSGIDYILQGMMNNDKPGQVMNGFQKGVAMGLSAKQARAKLEREAAIQAQKVGLDFDQNEEKNATQMDENAIGNLRSLAKPVLDHGSGTGNGRNNPFRWVPGTGYVDTSQLDENGIPKIVYKDSKTVVEARQKARNMAEKQAASQSQRIPFENDTQRQEFINKRTDEITFQMLQGASIAPNEGNAVSKIDPKILDGLEATESSGNPLAVNKETKALGAYQFLPETVVMLHKNGYKFNPFDRDQSRAAAEYLLNDLLTKNGGDMNKALAAYGGFVSKDPSGYIAKVKAAGGIAQAAPGATAPAAPASPTGDLPIIQPQQQKAMNATSEAVAKMQAANVAKLRDEATAGQNMISTVQELKQLKFTPGMFADWKKRGGNLMEALGNNGPLAKAAAQSGNAEALLQALSNARISLEHGVQTRDDEIRFQKEIASIKNPQEGYDYMLKHMQELGNKAQEKMNFYDNWRQQHGGVTYDGADQAWQQRNKQYGGMVKRYGGSFIGRSEFINAMMNDPANLKAYGGDKNKLQARAEAEWNKLGSK